MELGDGCVTTLVDCFILCVVFSCRSLAFFFFSPHCYQGLKSNLSQYVRCKQDLQSKSHIAAENMNLRGRGFNFLLNFIRTWGLLCYTETSVDHKMGVGLCSISQTEGVVPRSIRHNYGLQGKSIWGLHKTYCRMLGGGTTGRGGRDRCVLRRKKKKK